MSGTWGMVALNLAIVVGLVCIAKAWSDVSGGSWVVFVGLTTVLVFCVVAVPLRRDLLRQQQGMAQVTKQARFAAATDPLTGLPNRRSTDQMVVSLLASDVDFAVAICDLDRFKVLNDNFGHDAGDAALKVFATTLRKVVRDGDMVSRHGGEEFLVILPNARKEHGALVLDRARLELAVALSGSDVPPFTFSGGVADTSESRDWRTLLQLADQRLLRAKRLGRDRVLVAQP